MEDGVKHNNIGDSKFRVPDLAIMMATYNGEAFLKEQIESIINQTYSNWNLYILDDVSSDSTLNIINKYCSKDNRIRFLGINSRNSGPSQTFSKLMEHCLNKPYKFFGFADQDDVWKKDKILISLEILKRKDQNKPNCVHTDLEVVDRNLNRQHFSFMEQAKLKPENKKFDQLLYQNIVTGSTLVFNRILAELAWPIPDKALMHDWWIAQIGSLEGEIIFIPKKTVLYRQHSCNVIGASHKRYRLFAPLSSLKLYQKNFYGYLKQSNQIIARFIERGKSLNQFSDSYKALYKVQNKNFISRLIYILKFFPRKRTILKTMLLWFFFIFLFKKSKV